MLAFKLERRYGITNVKFVWKKSDIC